MEEPVVGAVAQVGLEQKNMFVRERFERLGHRVLLGTGYDEFEQELHAVVE